MPRWPGFMLPELPQFPFAEIPPEKSGIRWVHSNGKSPEKYLPETTGAGCAFLDYDNDGWMDIYLVNSGPCDFYTPKQPLRNALYHNNGNGTFTDVTRKAGLAGVRTRWGTGCAFVDYDRDGWPDLYVVNDFGRKNLYRNNGDGTFTEDPGGIRGSGRADPTACIARPASPGCCASSAGRKQCVRANVSDVSVLASGASMVAAPPKMAARRLAGCWRRCSTTRSLRW